MNERNQILYAGIGLWASGTLVGANAIGYLPGEPSWPPAVLLAIGLITTIGCSRLLFKKSQ
jgi:hypothetical protein